MNSVNILKNCSLLISTVLFLGAVLAANASLAAEAGHDQAALIKVLPKAKTSLANGLRQASKPPEVPISAKFEFDDAGKLSLSVYTAEKGVAVDAEHNILKELSGSPEQDRWVPEVEVFKDIPHVARSAEQLTLMSLARTSLANMIVQVQKKHSGTVFSITPVVKDHRPVAVILLVRKGKVRTLTQPL